MLKGQKLSPVEISKGVVSIREDMSISHEEGDTMIIQQAFSAAHSNEGVSIIADDTDVFVLLLHFYFELKCNVPMFMVSTDENEVIDIGLTVSEHEDIIPSMLGAHAMTGCDTVARCNTIGKKTAFNIMKPGCLLDLLGDLNEDIESVVSQATTFISRCYKKDCTETDMSNTRIKMWQQRFAKSSTTAKFLSTLPPTTEAFTQNVLRAHLQTYIWKSALQRHPVNLDPLDYGFKTNEITRTLDPILIPENFALAPEALLKLIKCSCAQEMSCKNAQCGCFKARLQCTTQFCNCENNLINCQNKV